MPEQANQMLEAVPSLFGVTCPVCRTCHMTPKGYVVISGQGECQVCGARFSVTEECAVVCNANKTLLRGILGSLGVTP